MFRVWLCFLLLLSADINAQGLSGIASADTASCQGQSTTLIIAASGGTPPYEYSINNGTNWQSSSSFTVTAGTYNQIKVKDASNAETTLSSLVVVDGPAGTTYYVDSDGDGYGVTSTATVLCYDPGFGYSTQSGDCNDANDAIYPGQTEVCNTIDDDCDGSTDEGLPTETYYVDADGDGFGTGNAIVSCADPGLGYSDNNADCNDGNSAVNPSATEICNGIDDNCNGFIDQFDQLLSPQGQVVITAEPLAAQTLCLNTTPTNLTLSVSGGKTSLGYSYQWYSNSTNAYAGSTAIAGQTTDMYTPPTNTAGTVYYFCIVLQPNALCNGDTTIRAAVTVQSVPLAGAINVDTTICSAGNPAAFVSTTNGSGSGTITYRWESNTNLATPSWNAVAGALSATYDVPAGLTVTTQYRRITVSTLNSNVCESSPTAAVQVTVNDVAAGSIGNAQTICEGDNPAAISNATSGTGSGTITYRWEMNTGTGWSVIPGASSSSYDTTALTADADYRRVAISTLNGVACEAISNSVTITVNNMDAGVIAGNQTICEGGDPVAFTSPTAATGDGAITYQWQSSADGVTYANISGATSETYNHGILSADTYFQRVATSTNSVNGAQTCVEISNAILVTVNNMDAGVIAGNQTICEGGDPVAFTSPTAATGDGAITYQWQSSADGVTYANISGATSETYNHGILSADTYFQRVATSTNSVNGAQTCVEISNAILVTVNNMDAGVIAGNQTICEGGDPVAFTSPTAATGDGAITYQWQSSADGVTYANISGATSETYNHGILSADTYFQRVATSTNSVNGAQTCVEISNAILVTVNNMDAGVIAGNQTICEGGDPVAFTSPTAATGDGAITYQWQSSADGVTYANISGATSETYNHGILSADTYFQRVATSTNSVNGAQTCVEISNAILVTVNNMDAGVIAGNQTICEGGDPVAFTSPTAATGDGAITFRWESSVSPFSSWAAIAGANSSTHDAPSGLGQTTKYRRVAISSLNGVACEAITNLITVTIDSIPTVANSGADIIQCNVADFLLNGNNPSIGIGQWSQISGDAVSLVTAAAYNSAANGLVAGGIAILRWTISNGVCPASIDDVVLINNQTPDAGAISGVSVECLTASTTTRTYSVTSLGGNTSYAWSFPAGFSITSGQGTNSVNVSVSNVAIGNGITGNICITASNSSCGSGVASCKAVELQSAAPVTPSSISGPGKICPQESGTYSISLVNRATSYSWTMPTGITQSTGGNTNVITASVGAGFVSSGDMIVRASNICGQSGQRIKLIGQKYPLAPSPISGTANGVCNMSAVTYSVGSSVNATSYSWTIPAGASFASGNSLNNVTVNFGTSSGAVTVSGVNTCGSGSIRSFTVAVAPGRPASISGLTSVCVNSTNPYTSSTVVGADSYNWLVPSGAVNLSGDVKTIDVQYGAVPALNQIIIVSATNECGTSASRSLAGIAINSCNINREEIVTDGFSALLYPNPMQGAGTLQINCEQDEQLTLRLTDVSGRLIAEKQINVQQGISSHDIRIEGQQPGFYLLQLQSSGISKVIRVIVE